MSRYISTEIISVDSLDVSSRTQYGAAQGGPLVGCGMEVVKYHLLHLLVNFLGGERGGEREREGGGREKEKGRGRGEIGRGGRL